jgi:hypothetical protein
MMFDVIRIPAFKDNYIWLLRKGAAAAVVDPAMRSRSSKCWSASTCL